jgi:ABC-2 type transport system permease protein
MYFLIAAMLPTFGVIVLGQDAIIQERQTGTAAWVLSKPVSRAAFILAKLFADAWGVLVTMVLLQGVIAYAIYKYATGISLSIPGWLAGLGMVYLFLISVQALTLMLGTLVKSRGQLLGISTAYVAGNITGVYSRARVG